MTRKPDIKKLILLNLPYLFAFYFVNKVAVVFRMAPGTEFVDKLTAGFANFSSAFANPLPSFNPMDLLIGAAAGALLKLAVCMKGKNRKKFRQGEEYGSARWGKPDDIKQVHIPDQDDAFNDIRREYSDMLQNQLTKYHFDHKAISEPIAPAPAERLKRGMKGGNKFGKAIPGQSQVQTINRPRERGEVTDAMINPLRNKRDVWIINTVPFKGGHYAAYPPKLVETCLLAGCPEGGIVLDPFMGSGTTGMVARQLNRHYVGIELNPAFTELAYARIGGEIWCPVKSTSQKTRLS